MKKINLGLSILACSFIFLGCPKKALNVAPKADSETESAIDAVWATYVVTDIDQIVGFIGEDNFDSHFYVQVPGQTSVTPVRDLDAKQKVLSWNNTLCLDGRLRHGSIFMYYEKDPISNPLANENSRYYRDFGFVGRIQLSDYRVDGWLIELFDPAAPAYVYNKLSSDKYDPTTERLTWLIAGKFLFTHPTDPTKNIVWDGQLTKTLTNSTDKDIFAVSKQSGINWVFKPTGANGQKKGAICSYSGKVSGMTNSNVPFKMTIDERTPLVRDFICSADVVSGVTAASNKSIIIEEEEHHPFINGIASFTTGDLYPRQIYFGNEGNQDLAPQCDIVGEVRIKGISHKVNFRK